jgi:D-alanine-D-alanine ligase
MANYGKIAVFAGGPSAERDISLKSGRAVYEALKRRDEDTDLFELNPGFDKKLNQFEGAVVFLALHGRFGEDGTIQAILEERNIPYTGSGVRASRLAMDKIASRELFLAGGLKAPGYRMITEPAAIEKVAKEFETPFVVKPRHEGSSIGLSIVRDSSEIKPAVEKAFGYDENVIVEEYIHGRELTVGILEDSPLPVIEIATKHNVYDFDAKYADLDTKYILPAELDGEAYKRSQDAALKAHRLLGCRDFSRVDMRMDKAGEVYVLEVNTIPGLTERSLLPKAARASGVNFEDLCVKLVDLAYNRKGKRNYGENER